MWALKLIAIPLSLCCFFADNKSIKPNIICSGSITAGAHLHKLTKLSVIGDFDGDGRKDTIYQHNFSELRHCEIDSAADPFQDSWDNVSNWFYEQQSDVYLATGKLSQDTLHLGTAQGLYCLLNIGDNNSDGCDEIAFVIDYCDFSSLNSCKIFTLCGRSWTELKRFAVNENAFVSKSDTMPVFKDVKGFLEKKAGRWLYRDYEKDIAEIQPMKLLKLKKCR